MQVSERLRLQLLKEEFKLRKKQPPSWTAQKYRKYANIGLKKKKEKPEFIEEEKDMEARLLLEKPKKGKKAKKPARKKAGKALKKKVPGTRAKKARGKRLAKKKKTRTKKKGKIRTAKKKRKQ